MLALAFQAGDLRLALPAQCVVEVLPRSVLRPVALAPPGVVGLLAFRGTLTPVVDLCRLVLGRDTRPLRSSRLVVVSLPHGGGERLVGLLAEQVLDLIPIGDTVPGLRLPDAPWLGEHLAEYAGTPQLMDPARLLPEALAALFALEAPA
jgi:chemotaxis-related protein WspB